MNASAAASVPLSSPKVSPVTRFFQAGLTSVGAKFNVAAYFIVKWSSAFQVRVFLVAVALFLKKVHVCLEASVPLLVA
jgi:hypothetical protein